MSKKHPAANDSPTEPDKDKDETGAVEELEFTVTKKGYDREEVETYIQHLMAEHEQELETVAERLREAQETTVKLQQQLEEEKQAAEHAREHAEAKIREYSERLEVVGDLSPEELRQLRESAEAAEEYKQEAGLLAARVIELQRQLEQAQQAAGSAGEPVDAQRLAELEAEVERLKKVEAEAEGLRPLADEVERLRPLEQQAEQVRQLQEENRRLRDQLESMASAQQGESIQLAEQLTTITMERDQARNRVAELEPQLEVLAGEVEKVKGKLEQATRQLKERDAQVKNLEKELKTANADKGAADKLKRAQREISELQSRCRQLEGQLEELEKTHSMAADQAQRYQEELEKARRRSDDLVKENAAARARIELLEREVENLRAQDFGFTAQKMMRALEEARREQEEEMAQAKQQAEEEIEAMRQEAMAEIEEYRRQEMTKVERAVAEQKQYNRRLSDQAAELMNNLQAQIDEMARKADERAAAARESEERLRRTVRAAAEMQLEQLRAQSEQLQRDIAELKAERDSLLGEHPATSGPSERDTQPVVQESMEPVTPSLEDEGAGEGDEDILTTEAISEDQEEPAPVFDAASTQNPLDAAAQTLPDPEPIPSVSELEPDQPSQEEAAGMEAPATAASGQLAAEPQPTPAAEEAPILIGDDSTPDTPASFESSAAADPAGQELVLGDPPVTGDQATRPTTFSGPEPLPDLPSDAVQMPAADLSVQPPPPPKPSVAEPSKPSLAELAQMSPSKRSRPKQAPQPAPSPDHQAAMMPQPQMPTGETTAPAVSAENAPGDATTPPAGEQAHDTGPQIFEEDD